MCSPLQVTYRASSPDEEALVKAAKALGYDFLTPAPMVTLKVTATGQKKMLHYQILNINEFNSTRKRMSVVVKVDGKYILYCKGADNVMAERSVKGSNKKKLTSALQTFASEGLRTLVLARRQLSVAEYEKWNQQYKQAAAMVVGREAAMMRVAAQVEVNLQIIGATAIEDKLQVGVPACIADLASAGIKIWVLTGDKEETAVNIGYACKLLTNSMHLIYVNQADTTAIKAQLDALTSLRATAVVRNNMSVRKLTESGSCCCSGWVTGIHCWHPTLLRSAPPTHWL